MLDPSPTLHRLSVPMVLVALVAVMPIVTGSTSTAGVVLIFGIAAAACGLLLGHAGILTFAQGSFFGVGSYTAAILLKSWPQVGVLGVLAGAVTGAVVALGIGLLSTRQRGIYSVMITLAMAQLVYFAALSFPTISGGENGLLEVPRPSLGLVAWLGDGGQQYLLIAIVFLACLGALLRIVRSPFGRVLDAVRANEVRAETLGYDGKRLKLQAFAISGALTGVAGALYATQLRSAPLSTIDLATSESILVMAILGGKRSAIGAVLGAFALVMMGEHLAELWPRWQMIVGIVLVAMVLFAPDGLGSLWSRMRSRRSTGRRLAGKGAAGASHWETT